MTLQNYSKTTWENTPSTATPLNAANLNNMENGIKAVTDAVIAMHSAGISPENIAATIVNAAKLPNGSNDELIKANSSGSFVRSGSFVTNDETKIIDSNSVSKYVPTAQAVAKKIPVNLSELQDDINLINMLSLLPSKFEEISGTIYNGLYVNSDLSIKSSGYVYTEVIEVNSGDYLKFISESYSTAGGRPAISKSISATPVQNNSVEAILAYGASDNEAFSFEYTATEHCYIYVTQHIDDTPQRGVLTIIKNVPEKAVGEENFELLQSHMYPLKNKKIAVLGDSIMQYMSGGYGGANTQVFEENGNTHTFDEITVVDGVPYCNGNVCTVVNEKQSYYDSQGWELLKTLTKANKILNCSIGGSTIGEGELSTEYPGFESGTHRTNSLPNLVRWLFRMCENDTDPDLAIIWMGTNGLGSRDGDMETIFNMPWETLSGTGGHEARQTTIGALRYAIEKIYREMPHTYILVLGPIQADTARYSGRTFSALKQRSDVMKSVANRLSVKFIEPLTEIEIVGDVDTASSPRYLRDGLHCNESGKKVLTDFLGKKIITDYQSK